MKGAGLSMWHAEKGADGAYLANVLDVWKLLHDLLLDAVDGRVDEEAEAVASRARGRLDLENVLLVLERDVEAASAPEDVGCIVLLELQHLLEIVEPREQAVGLTCQDQRMVCKL